MIHNLKRSLWFSFEDKIIETMRGHKQVIELQDRLRMLELDELTNLAAVAIDNLDLNDEIIVKRIS